MASPSSPVRLTSGPRRDDMLSEPIYDAAEEQERLAAAASQLAESQSVVTAALSQRRVVDDGFGQGDQDAQHSGTFLWGTFVNTTDTFKSIFEFFTQFKKDALDASPYYMQLIEKLFETEETALNLDCRNLEAFDRKTYQNLINYPQEIIPMFDAVATDIFHKVFADSPSALTRRIEVRTFNLLEVKSMRELNPDDIDKLVAIKGMVIRTSSIVPDLKEAFFECIECRNGVTVGIERGRILEPAKCTNCNLRSTMALIHNRCQYEDKQTIKLQETPDSIPEGSTPQTVQLTVHASLVDAAAPGDKVMVTGIYRVNAIRPSGGQRTLKQIYKTYIDVIHFQKTEKNRMGADGRDRELLTQQMDTDEIDTEAEERKHKIIELSKRRDIYDILTNAVGAHANIFVLIKAMLITRLKAPSIWEMDDVKKGILCQLFGGTPKKFDRAGSARFRSEINVLLCGDPGTSKSQMLQYVHKIAPRGIYTSGKGSSAVGLTAYITRDPDTGEHVLESGALVLSDRGICCIDEFDKMSDHTRSILHEAMEQQTVSVAKAGIICTLNARTSILASANPKESRYNPRMSVVENIQLPPTLLSRFDLIYLVLDSPDEGRDAKLARHIVSLYFSPDERRIAISTDSTSEKPVMSTQLLAQYISFARQTCEPQISDEAVEGLVSGYVDLRRRGESNKTITATTRQLESLIRISEAVAKMRLSPSVTRTDVEEAIRLMKLATYRAATDPRTGLLDMDLITTGHGAAQAERIKSLKARLQDLINQHYAAQAGTPLSVDQLYGTYVALSADREDVAREDFQSALQQLVDEELIAFTGARNRNIVKLS